MSDTMTEERIRRWLTYWRVPLLAIPSILLFLYVDRRVPFYFGAVVAIAGQAIQTWSGSHIHKDTRLTISGPYSHVRNPMYIGRFVLMLGFILMLWNVYLTAAYLVLFAYYAHTRVLREEARLKELFGTDYERYCSEVNRWLPRVRPYSAADPRKASWQAVRRNHEDIHFIGLALFLAAIYVRLLMFPDAWQRLFG